MQQKEHQAIIDIEFYREVFCRADVGMAVYDASGQCIEANEAIGRIIGASRDEVLAQNYYHIDSWKKRGLFKAALAAVKENRDINQEVTTVTSFGRNVTIDCRFIPFESSGTGYLLLLVSDITERKRAERALKLNEENMLLALKGADLGFWNWDVTQGTTYFSPRYFTMLGYAPDELPHTFDTWDSLLHPDDRKKTKAELMKCIEEKQGWNLEFRLRAKDGDYRWISGRGKVLEYDNQGRPVRSAGTHLDISGRRRTEEALINEKNKIEAVMTALGDGITVQDRNYKILYQNSNHKKIQGDHRGELCYEAYQRRSDVCPECLVARVFADGQSHRRETKARGRDGRTVYMEVSASPVYNAEGEIVSVVEAVRDITNRKVLESEMQKAQKIESLGVLAGGIAHDFNNILTAILSNIYMAKMHLDSGHKSYERLETAERALTKAGALSHQLLTFSRGGAPVKKPVSLASTLRDAALFALSGSNVKCEIDIAENLWSVEADEGQINQVINNLVVNADQAVPGGGIIYISASNTMVGRGANVPLSEGKYVRIDIKDQGIGMSDEHLKKIFDPYFTLKQKGNGLGLAVSYSIIKNHDGHIMAESKLGEGTVFTLYLPAVEHAITPDEYTNPGIIAGKGKILIMDDEENVIKSIGDILQHAGYDVEYAKDGNEALEKYREAMGSSTPFEIVIMDLTIAGGMGGRETMRALCKLDPNVKSIVSSGYSNDDIMANFRKYGFVDALPKPYSPKKLSQILHNVLKGASE